MVADQVLLTRLSDTSPVFAPGLWHLPGGGVDPGEQPVESLARELREETGLELVDARLVDARTYLVDRPGVRWQVVALFYMVQLRPGSIVVTEIGGSTCAAAWVARSGLLEAELSPPAVDGLRRLRATAAELVL